MHNIEVEKWSSTFIVHQNHPESWLKNRMMASISRVYDSVGQELGREIWIPIRFLDDVDAAGSENLRAIWYKILF